MKALTHEQLIETARNPVALKRYYQHMVMHWRRLAHENRKKSRQQALTYSIQGYKEVFEDGKELMKWAQVEDAMADIVGSTIDTWVRTTLEPAVCTCNRTINNDTDS